MGRRITDTELPPVLYKYRDWNDKFHRRLISKKEIYFPRPSEFNDPFDGNIPVRWDLMTFEDCYEMNLELLSVSIKDANPEALKNYARKVTNEKSLWHPDKLKKESSEQINKWGSMIGLLALSETPTNILMWSHYSSNHNGFIIGLNTESLANDYDFDYVEPIIYCEKYPLISGKDDTNIQFHKKFFHKSKLWEYEQEWRVSKNHIENRIVKLNPYTISELIIGCKIDPKSESQLIKTFRKSYGQEVPILKAIMLEDKFGIELIEI